VPGKTLMIQLKNVYRRYLQGDNLVVALDNVSLDIADFEFVAVTGESGSGKSTLLHLLGGLDQPDAGELIVNGVHLQVASETELTRYRSHDLGIVFQFFNLLPTLNVVENVALPLQLQGAKPSISSVRAAEMLALVGLAHRANHFVHQLSGGEMQRTAIARALVHRPKVLLADEPTGNLDGTNAGKVMEVFQKIASESLTTLVLVTHSGEIARMAQREIRLRNGKIAERSVRKTVFQTGS
jgi:putative ABC transport system ATP-binding protein